MATSSKVRFDLATLKDQALKALDAQIDLAQAKVDEHVDDEAFARRMDEWRARQEERLRNLVAQMDQGAVDDHRLSNFKLEEAPTQGDKYRMRSERERVDTLKSRRAQVEAKASSLVADEDGSVSLTKTQLREMFYL